MITLQSTPRDASASLNKLRENDQIPAVCYGNGEEAVSITVPRQETIKAYKELRESNGELTLALESGEKTVRFQDIQLDPVSHRLLHVDFILA